VSRVHALYTARPFGLFFAFFADGVLTVAFEVGAVHEAFGGFAAVKAVGNGKAIISVVNVNQDAFVEHVTFAVPQSPLHFRIFAVRNYSTFELIHVLEFFFQHVGGEFFASNSAGAIRDDVFVFEVFEVFFEPSGEEAERIDGRTDGAAKMTYVVLVISSAIKYHYIVALHHGVKIFRRQANTGFLRGVCGEVGVERDKFLF